MSRKISTFNFQLSIFILAATLFGGCTEVIDFDPGDVTPYPVLVAQACSDSTMNVFLTYSRFFLDDYGNNEVIDNATVTLDINGTKYAAVYNPDYYHYAGQGCYTLGVVPHAGDSLRVTATIDGMEGTISASTRVPQAPSATIVDYVIDTVPGYDEYYWDYSYGNENYYRVRLKIMSGSNDEYYAIKVFLPNYNYDEQRVFIGLDTVNLLKMYFSVNDPLVNSSDLAMVMDLEDGEFRGDELLVSSELFQNGEHEFVIDFSQYQSWEPVLDITKMPVFVEVRRLSNELYRYMLTSSQQSDFDALFSEPVQVYSNISGGIGIFGAFSQRRVGSYTPRFENFHHEEHY